MLEMASVNDTGQLFNAGLGGKMSNYELQIKQIVDYPLCRMYRQFVQSLIQDRSIRASGGSGLFYYTVLCCYTNFRTSYRHVDGNRYVVYPGEWILSVKELTRLFRVRFQYQAIAIMEDLKVRKLINYTSLGRNKIIKYWVCGWKKTNTVLDYNCPCQKDTGFFFMPISAAKEIITKGNCSEMDILLDLWISAIYNDPRVMGSDIGPVVYLRNGNGSPLLSFSELSARWGVSRATVCRVLRHLEALKHIKCISFSGKKGSVIYLNDYLSTMFQISDVLIDKEEVAMVLNIRIKLPAEDCKAKPKGASKHKVTVSDLSSSVSKAHIEIVLEKMAEVLDSQGLSCFRCPKSTYKLYSLSKDCRSIDIAENQSSQGICFGVSVLCGEDIPIRRFILTLYPIKDQGVMEVESWQN